MPNPRAAMLVIGDEILSGRTQDANMHHLAKTLSACGIDLIEAAFVSDDHKTIVGTVNRLRSDYDFVVTSGGIGPTHDDITADAIAAAFGAHIDVRPDARRILQTHYDAAGTTLNTARLRMARIPDGAELIKNPVSAAPGFRMENVYVMAGVPRIFQAMLDQVLPSLSKGDLMLSQSVRVHMGEGDIAGPLAKIAAENPDVSIGSYPFQTEGGYGANLVVRGLDKAQVDIAMGQISDAFGDHLE